MPLSAKVKQFLNLACVLADRARKAATRQRHQRLNVQPIGVDVSPVCARMVFGVGHEEPPDFGLMAFPRLGIGRIGANHAMNAFAAGKDKTNEKVRQL